MVKKNGKEVKLKNLDYNVKFGTVDDKDPKSLLISFSAWSEPKYKDYDLDYNKIIKQLNKDIKQTIFSNVDGKLFLKKNNIIYLDIRESGINFGKQSYMSCEITLFQTHRFKLQDKVIQNKIYELINIVIHDVFINHKYFKFYKNKTKL